MCAIFHLRCFDSESNWFIRPIIRQYDFRIVLVGYYNFLWSMTTRGSFYLQLFLDCFGIMVS